MKPNKKPDDLTDEQKILGTRVFDLLIDRVLRRVYSGFNEKTQKEMDEVFSSGSDDKKENFIRTNIPDFKNVFKEEAKKIEEEIKKDIKGHFMESNE